MAAAYQPRQAEIHNLYVPERRFTGEEDILRLKERNTPEVKLPNRYNAGIIIYVKLWYNYTFVALVNKANVFSPQKCQTQP